MVGEPLGDAVTEFYGEDQAMIHHREFGDLALSAADLVIDELRRNGLESGTVVDLGCGSGILARAVSEAGYRVLGVDLSPHMVELARAEAPLAEISCGSVHDAEVPPAVAVTAVGEVLNYATDARPGLEALASLAGRVAAALAPGGLFVFDVAMRGRHGPAGQRTVFHDREDWSLVMAADEHDQTLDRRIVVFRRTPSADGPGAGFYRRTDEHHVLRLYEAPEIERVLVDAGLDVERRAGYGQSATRSTPASGWGVFVARARSPGR
jgi:SAM-dependent methyltransferase